MKTLFKVFLTLFSLCLLLFPICANATSCNDSVWSLDTDTPYFIDGDKNPDGTYQKGNRIAKMIYLPDNEVVFCVEPEYGFDPCSSAYYEKKYHPDISSSQKSELSKIVFAYKQVDDQLDPKTSDYYVAAQLLIWEVLGYDLTVNGGKNAEDFGSSAIVDLIVKEEEKVITPQFEAVDEYEIGQTFALNDKNALLTNETYSVTYSNGVENVTITDNTLHFKIIDDNPETKILTLTPITSEKTYQTDDNGSYFIHSHYQDVFRYPGEISKKLGELTLYLTPKEKMGDLIIEKVDQDGNPIDGVTFVFYSAVLNSKGELSVGDEILNGKTFTTANGIICLNDTLPAGNYFIKEVDCPREYILDDSFIPVEIKDGEVTTVVVENKARDLTVNVLKKDEDDNHLINDTRFTIYSLNTGNDSIILLKRGNTYDLKDLFSLKNETVFFSANDAVNVKDYQLEAIKNARFKMYITQKEVDPPFILDGFSTFVQRVDKNVSVLNSLKVTSKEGDDITTSLKCIDQSQEDQLLYLIEYKDHGYLIKRGKNVYNIEDDRPLSTSDDYEIYRVASENDIYVINDDETLIKEKAKHLSVDIIDERITGRTYLQTSEDITIFNTVKEPVANFTTDGNKVDISSLDDGTYLYKDTVGNFIEFTKASEDGSVKFANLKGSGEYLLCEYQPASGYEYGDQNPCILVNKNTADTKNFVNTTFKNKTKEVTLELYKINTDRDILLNGAEFEVYADEYSLSSDISISEDQNEGDKRYIGKYISGYLHVDGDDFGTINDFEDLVLEIYKEGTLCKSLDMAKELNIGGLDDGTYTLKLKNVTLEDYPYKSITKKVAKGMIFIDGLKVNERVILKEVKAPMGYSLDADEFSVTLTDDKLSGKVPYFRINELLIIPPEKEKIKIEKIIPPTMTEYV